MNITKFMARHRWFSLALLAGIAVASCVPIRLEATWPGLSTIGDEQNILLAYNDRIVLVNPENGVPVALRTLDGEIKRDEERDPVAWEFFGSQNAPNQFFAVPPLMNDETLLVLTNASKRMFEVNFARPDVSLTDADGVELPGQVVATPLLVDDMLYFGAGRNLLAIDVNDQTEPRWSFETGQSIWSQPLLLGDVLYFTSLDHNLYALDPATGDELWRRDLEGAAPESPVFYEGRLYVGSFASKIFEIAPEDGAILHEYETEGWVWGQPAIVDGILYAADLGGKVYALYVDDSGFEVKWQEQVAEDAIRATPLVYDRFVIVGSKDQHVYWLNRETGLKRPDREPEEVAGEVLSDLLLIEPSEFVDIDEPYVIVSTLANEALLVAFTLQDAYPEWTYGR